MGDEGFRLDPAALKEMADFMANVASDLSKMQEQLTSQKNLLIASWEGAGVEGFKDDLDKFDSAAKNLIECFDERSRILTKNANDALDFSGSLKKTWS